jgi:dTDP-4-dehydrorhamnose 3,5-epimerase
MPKVIETPLPGLILFELQVFRDARGFFVETYHEGKYREAGLEATFAQDNMSSSSKHVLRGLHHQWPNPQGKLVSVVHGEIFDVAVDIRPDSPTYGKWHGELLSEENRRQLYIPEGFAHGFCVISDQALVTYKCTRVYDPNGDGSILFSDPDIGIVWPAEEPILSDKDRAAPLLRDLAPGRLPTC